MSNAILEGLKEKEKQLRKELEASEVYRNWAAMVTAMNVFEGGKPSVPKPEDVSKSTTFNEVYDINATWQEKVIYVVRKIESGFVSDIINELKELDTADEDTITQRVQGSVSQLLSKKILHVIQRSGKRIKVAIKQN